MVLDIEVVLLSGAANAGCETRLEAAIAEISKFWKTGSSISHMRSTIDIDDDVLAAARQLARRWGTSVGRVVSELLRQALAVPQSGSTEVGEQAAAHSGFRPFPARGGVLSDEQIDHLRGQEDI